MECPKCGTWNPDDKVRCWRCSAELPPPPKPRKSRRLSSQTWLWVVAILFSLLTLLAQCGLLDREGERGVGFKLAPMVNRPLVCLELRERYLSQVAFRTNRTLSRNSSLLMHL